MNPFLRFPYAALGVAAELAVALSPSGSATANYKWQRALRARRGIDERLRAFAAQRDSARALAWFHAPSVGEALMALPVMQALHRVPKAPQLAITWYSPSAESVASRFTADFRDYLPFDTARAARTALDALQPRVLAYSKLDVWPVLTETAAERGVRLGLIAATLGERSGRRGWAARALLGRAYAQLDFVAAVSADDAARLVELGVRPSVVTVAGDTRYDQVWDRVQRIDRNAPPVSLLSSERPTLIAGSTWPSDEEPLLAAWQHVRRRIPDARLVIVPHEPTLPRVTSLCAWGAGAGARSATLSDPGAANADVVVVDRVGVLAELYACADVAFVGGGFHRAGLHSVVEPAALGIPVTFGPEARWSRDAVDLVAAGGGRVASGAIALAEIVGEWLGDPASRSAAGADASAFVRAGLGATDRSLATIISQL